MGECLVVLPYLFLLSVRVLLSVACEALSCFLVSFGKAQRYSVEDAIVWEKVTAHCFLGCMLLAASEHRRRRALPVVHPLGTPPSTDRPLLETFQ